MSRQTKKSTTLALVANEAGKQNTRQDSERTNYKTAEFRMLFLSSIESSKTNPRTFFDVSALNELAESIKVRGVLQPILVKELKDESGLFEIIAGERRFRASKLAGLEYIPALIVELSDEEALDAQIIENLQRADVHPLDEARGYLHLKETARIDVAELARRVGKSESYVARRLQLVHLIDEAREDYKQGLIDLGHALEIARLGPDIQPYALEACYEERWSGGGVTVPDKTERARSVKELQDWIQRNVLLNLKQAPFKLDDTRLRDDSLTCLECPQRSGFNRGLFADIKEEDICSNVSCFNEKTQRLVQIKRDELSEKANKKLNNSKRSEQTGDSEEQEAAPYRETKSYEAPLLMNYYYKTERTPEDAIPASAYQIIEKKEGRCEFAEQGIMATGQDTGKTKWICREPGCKDHMGRYDRGTNTNFISTNGASSNKAATDEEAAIQRGKRKQELFDIKVAESTRRQVFAEALQKFTWPLDRTYLDRIAAEFFVRIPFTDANTIRVVLGREDLPSSSREIKKLLTKIEEMTDDELARFLLLCSIAHYGENHAGHKFADQKQVTDFAKEVDVDYRLIDAGVRVELSPKKHKWDAMRYLNEIKTGKDKPVKAEVWESQGQQARFKKYSGARKLDASDTQTKRQAA